MTIQKSRLMALVTVMLVFSIMVSLLVVPASAATFEVTYGIGYVDLGKIAGLIYELADADLHDSESYYNLATSLGYSGTRINPVTPDGSGLFFPARTAEALVNKYNSMYPDTPIVVPKLPEYKDNDGELFYKITSHDCVDSVRNPNIGKYT